MLVLAVSLIYLIGLAVTFIVMSSMYGGVDDAVYIFGISLFWFIFVPVIGIFNIIEKIYDISVILIDKVYNHAHTKYHASKIE